MKINKLIAGALSVLVMGGTLPAIQFAAPAMTSFAEEAEYTKVKEGVLTYRIYPDHALVLQCDKSVEGEVIIPAKINGVPVNTIASDAFENCLSLTSVSIPDSVVSICDNAFGFCNALTSVSIPDSVVNIGQLAFVDCYALASITIPDSDVSIGKGAFWRTKWLEERRAENPLVIENGILIDGYECTGDVVIPEGVRIIAEGAFTSCNSITSVTLPYSLKTFADGAFHWCAALETLVIQSKNCEIKRSFDPICNGYDDVGGGYYYDGVIRGYEGSTAQVYAEKYGYNFESLGEAPGDFTYGDVTEDGKIDLNDAVAILQYSALPKKYPLSEKALLAADVLDNGTSGITGKDALVIMMVDAGLVQPDKLPLTSADI